MIKVMNDGLAREEPAGAGQMFACREAQEAGREQFPFKFQEV